ncbi:MAG TPA: hypothetical protein VM095_08075 [Pyrinomonadaceae bacterium]|nr:hypothetical protein [Pyrinomonadaceae bacterium]
MNTGTRRFILRLAVGLLAFLLGVTAAWALGGFNPFQSSPGTRYYRYKRVYSYRNLDAPRSMERFDGESFDGGIYMEHGHGCRARRNFGELTPPPPPPPPSAPSIAR